MFCLPQLNKLNIQRGSPSGSSTPSQSNRWMSKPSWTTHVPPGDESSLWKTTTTKVGFCKGCSYCPAPTLHDHHQQPNSNTLLGLMQPGPSHWSVSSGVLWWHVSIGSATATRCGGICLLAEGRLTVVCPHCRQGIGIVVRFCKCERQRGRVLSDFLN